MATYRCWLRWLARLALVVGLGGIVAVWQYQVSRPEYRLRAGREALLRHDWTAVREQADRLESSGYPDHAHLLRGQIHLHLGELAKAVQEYNAIRHDQPEILAEASLVYGLAFLSLGKLVEAERLLRYVLEVRPDEVDAHRGMAKLYYERGALTRAVKHLEKWSRLAAEEGEPHRWMGLAYEGLGADAPAVEQYRLALAKNLTPRLRQEVVVELAELLVKQRNCAEALACLDGSKIEAFPKPSAVLELRAECLYGVGRGAEAAQDLDPLLAAQPPSPRALRVRAQIHAAAGETGAAAALLEKALQLDSHDHASRYQLVQAYEALGRRKEAAEQRLLLEQTEELLKQLSDLNQEANDKPTDPEIRRRLAKVCASLGKEDLAKMWLRAVAACPPETAPSP
jgi:tetratricopeptide (TPR) repeat protein